MKRAIIWLLLLIPSRAGAEDAGPASAPTADLGAIGPGIELILDTGPASAPTSQPMAGQAKPAWAPRLSATVKPAQAAIGDPITVTITLRHGQGVSVNLPLSLELGKFSELSRGESTRELGVDGAARETERTFSLKVAAYELGQQTIPPIEVTALGPAGELTTTSTTAFPIDIKSVLRNEPNPKLKGLEPSVSVFQRTWWLLYLIIALAAVGVIVTATLLISRYLRAKREREKPPPPPIPPHVTALERLGQIVVEEYIEGGQYKELYLLLSEIIKEYVGGRWGFGALEMTSSEINFSLEARQVESTTRQRFDLFFAECDLVKFAKHLPEPDEARTALTETEDLVRSTYANQTWRGDEPA